jgi:hypothetical protein
VLAVTVTVTADIEEVRAFTPSAVCSTVERSADLSLSSSAVAESSQHSHGRQDRRQRPFSTASPRVGELEAADATNGRP